MVFTVFFYGSSRLLILVISSHLTNKTLTNKMCTSQEGESMYEILLTNSKL